MEYRAGVGLGGAGVNIRLRMGRADEVRKIVDQMSKYSTHSGGDGGGEGGCEGGGESGGEGGGGAGVINSG